MRHIVWFSCGAASTITARIVLKNYPDAMLVYCDTGSEHPDNARYIADVEKWLRLKVVVLKSERYADHFDVIEKTRYINGPNGARCTVELKKRMRFDFQQPDDIQYFGYTVEEKHRAERLKEAYPEINAEFPLISNGLDKEQCVGLLWRWNIEPPMMYRLGFNNNNCIGCVKGGMGYWNKIRREFPEKFERMAKLEREIKATCIKGVYLDELSETAGTHNDLQITCDFVCASMD